MRGLHPDDIMGVRRYLCKNDLYYLLRYELSTKYAVNIADSRPLLDHDFIFDRCREVQDAPDGYLDLWARYHFKTTIVVFALSIQTIIQNPERTLCILSYNNPKATDKLMQIKRELENNHDFVELFNDVFFHDIRKYQRWSEDKGLIVNRRGNPQVCTFNAYGLVDSQPTGDHYSHRVYDDVVVQDSVRSDISIANTLSAWELSLNLGMEGGVERYTGTRYHFNDTYATMIDRGRVKLRKYPCFKVKEDGTLTDEPVLYGSEYLENERRGMGPWTWAAQMLLDPNADSVSGFDTKWAKRYTRPPDQERNGRMVYLVVDPASSQEKNADWTAMVVVGLGSDKKIRLLDVVHDRINLTRRWQLLKYLHAKWHPRHVLYERVGKDAEVEYMREAMMRDGYVFEIQEVGGITKKQVRINRLIPLFENGDILLPRDLIYQREFDKSIINVTDYLIHQEMKGYPLSDNDHMLDALSRLYDPEVYLQWPKSDFDPLTGEPRKKKDPYALDYEPNRYGATWCSI